MDDYGAFTTNGIFQNAVCDRTKKSWKKENSLVSTPKNKEYCSKERRNDDKSPIQVNDGTTDGVDEFLYRFSVIAASGRMDADIERRIGQASRAFGALRKAILVDKTLKLETKRKVYQACVLSVLLYGSVCWKLSSFHH